MQVTHREYRRLQAMQFKLDELIVFLKAAKLEALKLAGEQSGDPFSVVIYMNTEDAEYKFSEIDEFAGEARRHTVKGVHFLAGTTIKHSYGVSFKLDKLSGSLLVRGADDSLVKGVSIKLNRLIEEHGRKTEEPVESLLLPDLPPDSQPAPEETDPVTPPASSLPVQIAVREGRRPTWRTVGEIITILAGAVGFIKGLLWILDRLQ